MLVLSESFKNKLLPMNGYMKGGSDSGSKAQARATEKGIELQREMWQTNMQNLAPFTPLAQQYVSELQNLSSLQGQGQALNQYYNSQQYKDLAGQARYQSLAAAEATGGLGSTATGNQLAAIAPTLGQNWLSGQMNNYNNLANIGLGALTGQANAGQNYANNVSQLYQQQAAASAANAISRANALTSAYAPTAAMQNYNQYAQMLKADPDGAAAFAAAAGINPNAKKLLKVETNPDGSVTKYYTDGSEEAGKLNQPISGDGIKPISLPQAQSIIDKANEGSKKAAGFALRLKDSMDSMNQLSKSIDPKRVALINRSLGDGTIANLSLSPAEQQYMVNARDALYAILRPETGAAITLPEMQEYSKMYLPQPGDSKAATETKMRKMQGQYNSLRGQSGRVYDALVVSSAANSQQQSNSQQPTNTQQQQSQSGSYTSKSGIQFTVE